MVEIRSLLKDDNFEDDQIIDYFTSFRDSELREVFVAVDGNRIVGYITVYIKQQPYYWQVKRVGDISGLMVHKEYRHRGIANRLFLNAKEFLANQEVKYFTVFTAVENQGAIDFYEQNNLIPLYSTLIGEIQDLSTRL